MVAETGSDQQLRDVLEIASALSSEADLPRLLDLILAKARALTSADAGSIYLVEKGKNARFGLSESGEADVDKLWFAAAQNSSLEARSLGKDQIDPDAIETNRSQVFDVRFPISAERLVGWAVLERETLNIPDVYHLDPSLPYQFDASVDRQLGYRAVSMMSVPMQADNGDVVGVLQLINRKKDFRFVITPENATDNTLAFDRSDQVLIEALSNVAAVCVQRTQLMASQDQLLDSVIALMAGAIDAKSPYTAGHCERVPQLAMMLAKEAEDQQDGPFQDFAFEDAEAWREFRIGAWLHDCGKVTTPEYVVDKASKLEANFNRIHEIRTRFEVLLRDAQIARLEGRLAGGDPAQLDQDFEARQQELQDQFQFIAAANLGAEFFDQEKITRLQEIAKQTWVRHFDDSLGLAWEESQRRLAHSPAADQLPVVEQLLSDQPWQRKKRSESEALPEGYGFDLDVPEDTFNYGELHNLSVSRGTLTPEERYKINEHVVQTIVMLESLPLPRGLMRVPEYAGTHHETLRGDGYPRKLPPEKLSVPSRIMAICDIFEALTASDRPYKKAKSLSVAVDILAGFRDRGHIDSDLFELFLTSDVYRQYAEQFMAEDQIDPVDIEKYLKAT